MRDITIYNTWGENYAISATRDDNVRFDDNDVPEEIKDAVNAIIYYYTDRKTAEEQTTEELLDYVVKNTTVEQQVGMTAAFPCYKVNKSYDVGDKFQYKNVLYEVTEKHRAQEDLVPDMETERYKRLSPVEEEDKIKEFVQPTGAHDAYKLGARIRYNGKVYESTIDNNAYSPDAYPRGWKEIGE